MRRTILPIVAGILLVGLGIAAYAGADPSYNEIILPAVPLYLMSARMDPSATHGLLWDSAHSPPFLNPLGILCVYIIPGFLLLGIAFVKRARPASTASAASRVNCNAAPDAAPLVGALPSAILFGVRVRAGEREVR
jgi:hypothetical protein